MFYNGFEYKIIENKVIITGFNDSSITHIEIPNVIDGYPVTMIGSLETLYTEELIIPNSVNDISCIGLRNHGMLKYINAQPIIDGFCVINNRFIYYHGMVYRIVYNIGGDYFVGYSMLSYSYNCYFIDGFLYYENFNKQFWLLNNFNYLCNELRTKTF